MGERTAIQWTDSTWNPVSGCTPASPGCDHCYARKIAVLWHGGFKVTCHPERLEIPLRWKTPRKVFLCSMGDLFHDDVPTEFILSVFEVMAAATQHTFQVLTKRPERMLHLLAYGDRLVCDSAEHHRLLCMMPLPNVWLGVTAENQEMADRRIPILLQVPAAIRFVSVEPMLGPVNLRRYLRWYRMASPAPDLSMPTLDWVICGCETGPRARFTDIEWARDLKHICVQSHTPFFLKRLLPRGDESPELDGQRWQQFPHGGAADA